MDIGLIVGIIGGISTIILGIVTIVQTRKIYHLTNRIRKILFMYIYRPIFTIYETPYSVDIIFEGNKYENLVFYKCKISNEGIFLSCDEDILEEISIKSSVKIKILKFKATKIQENSSIKIVPSLNIVTQDLFKITFDKLNKGEEIEFEFLCEQSSERIDLLINGRYRNEAPKDKMESRCWDWEHPPLSGRGPDPMIYILGPLALMGGIGAAYYFSFVYAQKLFYGLFINGLRYTKESSEILSFFIALIPSFLITYFIFWIIRNIIKAKKEKKRKKGKSTQQLLSQNS